MISILLWRIATSLCATSGPPRRPRETARLRATARATPPPFVGDPLQGRLGFPRRVADSARDDRTAVGTAACKYPPASTQWEQRHDRNDEAKRTPRRHVRGARGQR